MLVQRNGVLALAGAGGAAEIHTVITVVTCSISYYSSFRLQLQGTIYSRKCGSNH